MNIIETWNDLSEWWLRCAVHITWQGSLLAALALGLLLLARRWPSPLRHALLLLVLVKFLVPPFLATPTGAFSQVQLASSEVVAPAGESVAAPTMTGESVASLPVVASAAVAQPVVSTVGSASTPTAPHTAMTVPTWQAWLAGLWALGAVFAATRTFAAMRSLAQLRRSGVAAPSQLQQQFAQLVAEIGIRSKPRLVVTTESVGPAAFGVLRPTVLIPQAILGMPANELRLVLAHELVHHRRYDLMISWLQVAVSIVWWFNPLVRLVDRSVRRVREECCDDLLLARGIADGETYCQSLLRTACLIGVTRQTKLSAAYNEHPMGCRFRRIMDRTRRQRSRLGLSGSAAVLTMACVALPGVGEVVPQDPQPQVEVAGIVVDAAGQPVAGAYIYAGSDAQGAAPRTATGVDGKFIFSCATPKNGKAVTVVATKKGHGMQWGKHESGKSVDLKLTRDVPIRGQLLDQEGQPLVGAQLSVLLMWASEDESIDLMLAKMKSGDAIKSHPMWNTMKRRFSGPGFPVKIATDGEGRFTAAGFGAERAVVFVVAAEGATTAAFTVLTRDLETFTYPDGGARSIMGARTFYGEEFVYIAPAGRTVHGRVVDEEGKPLAGAEVRAQIPSGTDASGSKISSVDNYQGEAAGAITPSYLRETSDADGRFVMTGLPQTKFSIMTVDGHDIGYLHDSARIPNEDGKPIELDFQLSRAALVKGKVLDERGKPVVGVRVQYQAPMGSVGFQRGDGDGIVTMQNGCKTAADGSYRLVVPAGDVKFSVYAGGKYQPAKLKKGVMLGFMGGAMSALLEMKAAAGDNDAPDVVLRFADRATVVIADPDGKPLPGCRVVGRDLMDLWSESLPESKVVLRGFNKDQPRLVAAYHKERNLIGLLKPEALQGKQPWRIETKRAATIRGRLVDVDGAPRVGVRIYVSAGMGSLSMGVTGPMGTLAGLRKTDAEGRFTLEALLPGATYQVLTLDESIYDRRRLFRSVKVKAGEVKDVGDCVGELIN